MPTPTRRSPSPGGARHRGASSRRNPRFEQVSPEVGELDEAAVEEGLVEDPDEMLAMLADLAGATDQRLRDLARRLAARLFLDLARRGPSARRGVGKIIEQPYQPDGGDLDLDASFDDDRSKPSPPARRSTPTDCGSDRGAHPTPRCAWWSIAADRWAASRWRPQQ